ncbi:hypothetical protein CL634_08985 [bacterium]|nr:hypothetical protein [bacterium]
MAVNLIKTVNFGSSKSGLSSPGYRIYSTSGALSGSRATSVGEVLAGSGIYSASVHIADNFTGHILWDTGESTPTYASEDVDNTLHTLSLMSSSIDATFHMTTGKWEIDSDTKQMIFYKEDNTTELTRFNLFDENDNPSVKSVFSRVKV